MKKAKKLNISLKEQRIKLWDEMSIDDLLTVCLEKKPDNGFRQKGSSIIGQCIYHAESTPSLYITPKKGKVKCFGNSCGRFERDPIRFIQYLLGGTFSEALNFAKIRFKLKTLPTSQIKAVEEHEKYQIWKRKFFDFTHEKLVNACAEYKIDPNNSEYHYIKPLLEYLEKRIDITNVHALPIGTMPTEHDLGMAFQQTEPEMYKWLKNTYLTKYLGHFYIGWLVFPLEDFPGNICRFKFRKPDSKDFVLLEDPNYKEGDFIGAFGLEYYKELLGKQLATKAYVCEGEFDALSSMSHQVSTGSQDFIVLSLGGGMQSGADFLAPLDIEHIYIVPDNDDPGRSWAQEVLSKTRLLGSHVFEWPAQFAAIKDPDEAVVSLGYETFKNALLEPRSFLHAHEYIYEMAAAEISNAAGNDIRTRSAIAVTYGRKLRNQTEANEYIKRICAVYGLDSAILVQDIIAKNVDQEDFIDRIANVLKELFHVIGVSSNERKTMLRLWHKATRTPLDVYLNDEGDIENKLSRTVGTVLDFVKNEVGEPAYLVNRESQEELEETALALKLQAKLAEYKFAIGQALLQLSQDKPDFKKANKRSQGFHYKPVANEHRGYLVNGKDVYKWYFENEKVKWTTLTGPSDEGVIFEIEENDRWLKSVNQISDLNHTADLKSIYDRLYKVLNIGWSFKHQDTDTRFLAGYIMTLPISNAFTRQTSLIFNGEAESGKSRITFGLIGGSSYPRINVISGVCAFEDYTAAGVKQSMNNKTLAVCLDEFEDKGIHDKKSVTVRNVLNLARTFISEGESKVVQGGANGIQDRYNLRFPLICAAIQPLREQADITRFIAVEMKKQVGRIDPVQAILSEFGADEVAVLKKDLDLGMFQHVAKIRAAYEAIETEYAKGHQLPAGVNTRQKEAVYPVLAVMKAAGVDYQKFAKEFFETRIEEILTVSSFTENEMLFETILNVPIRVGNDPTHPSGTTTVRAMLCTEDGRRELNEKRCGVYFDEQSNWLIVYWIEALHNALANTRYKVDGISNVRTIADRSKRLIKSQDLTKQGDAFTSKLRKLMGPGVRAKDVSVFSIQDLIDEVTPTETKPLEPSVDGKVLKIVGDDDMMV